jgi:hypothetical protein
MLNFTSNPALNAKPDDVNVTKVGDEVPEGAVEGRVVEHDSPAPDDVTVPEPLDGSPTKKVSPPMGALRPAEFSNWVRLKFVRTEGAITFSVAKFGG